MGKKKYIIIGFLVSLSTILYAQDNQSLQVDFASLRNKWKITLLGKGGSEKDPDFVKRTQETISSASRYWSSLQPAASRIDEQTNYLWKEASSTNSSQQMGENYKRLRIMCLAYQLTLAGEKYYHNAQLKHDILDGLDWMYHNRYYIRKLYDNWFEWEIGAPNSLNDIMVLMYDDISTKQRADWGAVIDYFCPNQASQDDDYKFWGANRVWRATIHALRGVVAGRADKMQLSRDGLSGVSDGQNGKRSVFAYVTSGDGFYKDGSYIQHYGSAYNGGYGVSLLYNMAEVLYLLHGTPWQVSDRETGIVCDWVYQSFQPLIYKHGEFMDMVRGREISRAGNTDIKAGGAAIMAMIRLTQLVPEPHRTNFKRMVKYWLINNYSLTNSFSAEKIVSAKQILNDPAIRPIEEPTGNYVFAGMDRVVHLRKNWGFGLSLCSTRQIYYESHNSNLENVKAWYTADGMTYLYMADQKQYSDDFWPTVNYYKMPGTTEDEGLVRADRSGYTWDPMTYSSKIWAGGVTNGQFGAAGMEQDAWGATLTSKKSWFMFDNEIVALGAGINSTDNRPIQTIVENRKLNDDGNNQLIVDGKIEPVTTTSEPKAYKNVSWIYLSGNVPNADMGYYFPGKGQEIKAFREHAEGKWSNINKGGSTTIHKRAYQQLWIDHGNSPKNQSYAYVLLPNASVSQINTYAKSPDIVIAANSPEVQAVLENKLHILQANFWTDTLTELKQQGKVILTASKKASVQISRLPKRLKIDISDPTQLNNNFVDIAYAHPATAVISKDPEIQVLQLTPQVKIRVTVKNTFGKSLHIQLKTD